MSMAHNYSYLTIPFERFRTEIEDITNDASPLLSQSISSEEELLDFENKTDEWLTAVNSILSNSFADNNNILVREFKQGQNSYVINSIQQVQKTLAERVRQKKEAIRLRQDYLGYNLNIINVCDLIKSKDSVDLLIRSNYTVNEKLNLIVEKLYILNDGRQYPVEIILEGNGIVLRNNREASDLVRVLKNRGYVDDGIAQGARASITVEGSIYVEEMLQPYKENYENINSNQNNVNATIDSLIEKLTNLGLGQEILFNELQELKELYSTLNKKNWGQILKGKLMDLALSKLIETDTLKFVYHSITGNDFKFLG